MAVPGFPTEKPSNEEVTFQSDTYSHFFTGGKSHEKRKGLRRPKELERKAGP